MPNESLIVGVGSALAVIGLSTIPSVSGVVKQLYKRQPRDDAVYEDADGKATPETVKAFSTKLPKALLLLLAFLGTGTSLAISILATLHGTRDDALIWNWLTSAAWVFLLVQSIATVATRDSTKAYGYGAYLFVSGLVQAYVLLAHDTNEAGDLLHHYPVLFGLRVTELVAVVALSFAAILLPRRPLVFYNGEPVDHMYSASALSRYTFAWPSDILTLSAKKKTLELNDFPRPDHATRAKDVSAAWKAKGLSYERLWLSVIRAHAYGFAKQWVLTLGTAILNFAPQWVILKILRILERRLPGQTFGLDVWIWVVWLGVVIIAQALLEGYVFWLSWAELCIPVRAQLSALVFEKSLRRKDVKSTRKKTSKDNASDANESSGNDEEDGNDEELETAKKSKQGTVNLIGVDSKRISDFCSFQNMFPGSLFKLIVSLTFLTNLLGWKALLAGFASMIAIIPLNIHFSKLYSHAQDHLMKLRDEKLAIVTEALQGIRQIKFSALEPEWEGKIGEVRERELKSVWSVFVYDTVLLACWITSPIALSAISLAVYALLYGELTPSVAFVSLGVFRALEVTLSVVPELTTDLLDAWVSIKRIEEYLVSPDIVDLAEDNDEVVFEKASIAWPSEDDLDESERFVLRNLDFAFPAGELSVISGKTGAGKSLLLASILGEVDLLAGKLYIPKAVSLQERHDDKANKGNWILPKSIAYVAQIPWIENASIRNNILFGLPFDEDRYRKTIDACALTKDMEMFSDGELTEIGANGINLSGGQKWRITLARAIYSRAGILVMDDIFSAVDAHVGRHIFEKCVSGELCAGRTRILVTHHVALCAPKTKFLVELGEGRVLNAGLVSELAEEGILERIKSHEQNAAEINEDETADATAVNSDNSTENGEQSEENGASNGAKPQSNANEPPKEVRKFVEEETREQGAVRKRIYASYLNASGGWWFWSAALFLFVVVEMVSVGRSWWLRIWTGSYENHDEAANNYSTPSGQQVMGLSSSGYFGVRQQASVFSSSGLSASSTGQVGGLPHAYMTTVGGNAVLATSTTGNSTTYYLSVYVLLAIFSAVIGTFRYFWVYIGSIRASRLLFAKLNFIILRAPLRWLDTVPVGRVLNRFTSDFNIIDTQLANSISFGTGAFIHLFGVVAAGLLVSPYIVLLSFTLLFVCGYFAFFYIVAARPCKRLESTAKSPVFEQFGTALSGVATIRGFDKAQPYIDRMYTRLDDWSTTLWHMILFNRWVGWRMSLVGSIYTVVVAAIIMASPTMDSALAGFALAFALDFSSSVMWAVRLYTNAELQMNAAERIIEYTELPTESLEGEVPPAAWPTEGRIEVDNLVVSYASDLPPVLKGLTFRVERNQRVGVVGRTGAGKSSLTLAFFRFLEAKSGSIHIDGIDISKMKLHDLRERLAIIPQDPVLFSGTIRTNLDPFNAHTDEELRDCLERVHLTSRASGVSTPLPTGAATPSSEAGNANVFDDLHSHVSEGGLNLSQGQRQLLCLARAIVRRPRVMVLDEATSAVDMHTDGLIQRSIREEFTDATLLVIAHRLSTIADFDRILVLSDGKVAEFGTPQELWNKGPEEGVFRGMCEESGERDKLEKVVFGQTQ